jgi:O-antigen/teichoic acid export membrane protein
MTNVDKVLIQLFWNATDVGYYFASSRICGFIVMAGASLGALLFPTISNLYSKKDTEGIKQILYQSERYTSMITFPMVVGLAVLAEPSIHILLSDEFLPAINIFRILPLYALFYALIIPYEAQILGMDKPGYARNRILIMVACNLLLNIILIPRDIQSIGLKLFGLGATGAAIATVASYFLGLIYLRYATWKLIKVKTNYRVFLHLFAAVVMGSILYEINNIIYIDRWYVLFGVGFLGLGIYFGILFITREFKKSDYYFFLDTLNVKKMFIYILKEVRRK